jgi:hypothetical protein
MSKGLYIAIALLVTVAAGLVFVKGKDSQRSTIHVKGPSSQNQNNKEKNSKTSMILGLAPQALCCRPLRGLERLSGDPGLAPQALCCRPLRGLERLFYR